jgi:P-type E1-E2 ATPase
VQQLSNAGIEPVLLSGDARETCERVATALGVQHVRPEVLPAERAREVQRLVDTGASVAVIGQRPADDAALGATDVSIALNAAGRAATGSAVELVSDQALDAAHALTLARRTRRITLRTLVGMTVPGGLGLLLAFLGAPLEVPATLIPLGMLLGVRALQRHALTEPMPASELDEPQPPLPVVS